MEEKENVSLQEHCSFSQFKFSSSPLAFLWFCVPSINVALLMPRLRNASNDNIHSKSHILHS